MENKIVCQFKGEKQNFYDYHKSSTIFRIGSCLNPSIITLSLALLICLIIMKKVGMLIPFMLILFVALVVIFLLFIEFAYLPLIYKIKCKDDVKRYGETQNGINEILFDDDNLVYVYGDDRICIPYNSIRKIVESSSIYSLRIIGTRNIMIPKGSGVNVDDEEILAFLKDKTGLSIVDNKSKRKVIKIVLTTVVAIVSFLLVALTWICLGVASWTEKGDENDYLSDYITEDNILETAGNYENVYFQMHDKKIGPFLSTATLLMLDYTSENYYKQIEFINNNYSFLDAPKGCFLSENEYDIDDWHFKVCADGWYPSCFRTIGFNEKCHSIVYIDFSDSDLDYLCEKFEPMEECFIDEYVGYDFYD